MSPNGDNVLESSKRIASEFKFCQMRTNEVGETVGHAGAVQFRAARYNSRDVRVRVINALTKSW